MHPGSRLLARKRSLDMRSVPLRFGRVARLRGQIAPVRRSAPMVRNDPQPVIRRTGAIDQAADEQRSEQDCEPLDRSGNKRARAEACRRQRPTTDEGPQRRPRPFGSFIADRSGEQLLPNHGPSRGGHELKPKLPSGPRSSSAKTSASALTESPSASPGTSLRRRARSQRRPLHRADTFLGRGVPGFAPVQTPRPTCDRSATLGAACQWPEARPPRGLTSAPAALFRRVGGRGARNSRLTVE
jgi:hypothetical protein